nr:MAG TPA_asm: hypothetical protein [Caudoviricetes sp.]
MYYFFILTILSIIFFNSFLSISFEGSIPLVFKLSFIFCIKFFICYYHLLTKNKI